MKNIFLLLLIMLLSCKPTSNKKGNVQKDSIDTKSEQTNKYEKITQKTETAKTIPAHFEPFRGAWVRTDFLNMVQKTKSVRQTLNNIADKEALSVNLLSPNGNDIWFGIYDYYTMLPVGGTLSYTAKSEKYGFPFLEGTEKKWIAITNNQLQITTLKNNNYTWKLYTH